MIDCNKTINFFKEFKRMCGNHYLCEMCPIKGAKNSSSCGEFVSDNLEKTIEIVQKWSDKNPQKTLLDDFKEKYPNYQKSFKDGTPSICPYKLGYEDSGNCPADTCKECWNRPLDEVKKQLEKETEK